MAHAMSKVEGYVSRKDLFYVNPRSIVVVDGFNPRTDFSGEEELIQSIINVGVLEALEVRKNKENILELVDGERRLRATLKAIEQGNDIVSVPCYLVKQNTNEIDLLVRALTRNTGKPLTPVEEANSFQKLINWGWNVEKVASFIGRSIPYVYKRLELCAASPELEKAINQKEITLNEARKVINNSDGKIEVQEEQIKEIKQQKEEKAFEKEAIKEKVYCERVLDYIKYKKDLSTLHRKLQAAFKIKGESMDYATISDECMNMISLLEEIANYQDGV
jgi:ParB/RepB/Spo0J family partition protein